MAKKVLIVDDEADWVQMLAMRLNREGYETELAYDTIKGMAALNTVKPDIVVLDVKMPAEGGIGMLSTIRQNKETASLPVMIMTASVGATDIRKEATALGISGYFEKPVNMTELVECLKAEMEKLP